MNLLGKALILCLVLGLISTVIIFSVLFIKNSQAEITGELNNQIQNNLVDLIDTQTLNAIDDTHNNYMAVEYPIDLLMIIVFVTFIFLIALLSYLTPPLSSFNFLSFMTFGIMILLLAINFLKQIQDYLREILLTNVFTAIETALPFYNWYMNNYPIIATCLIIGAITINQFSRLNNTNLSELNESIREE